MPISVQRPLECSGGVRLSILSILFRFGNQFTTPPHPSLVQTANGKEGRVYRFRQTSRLLLLLLRRGAVRAPGAVGTSGPVIFAGLLVWRGRAEAAGAPSAAARQTTADRGDNEGAAGSDRCELVLPPVQTLAELPLSASSSERRSADSIHPSCHIRRHSLSTHPPPVSTALHCSLSLVLIGFLTSPRGGSASSLSSLWSLRFSEGGDGIHA